MESRKVNSKLLLVALILALISLLLLNYFFDSNRVDGIWDYKNIDNIRTIISEGTRTYERETYYNLEEIVKQYLNSYLEDKNDSDDNLTYEDYYKYLTETYRNYLSKREYKEVAEKFLDKFYININSDYESMDTDNIIQEIYQFENDTYLCKLEGTYKNEVGYLALRVNMTENQFYIVYIE